MNQIKIMIHLYKNTSLLRKAYLLTATALLVISMWDFSLWFIDQQVGDEKGVIFSYNLSSLIFKTNVLALSVLFLFLIALTGEQLMRGITRNQVIIKFMIWIKFALKDLSLSVIIFVIAIFLIDGIFYIFLNTKDTYNGPVVNENFDSKFYQTDAVLGFKPTKNIKSQFFKYSIENSKDTTTIWNVTYTTNSQGLRTFEVPDSNKRDKYALFFGCSYTFGVGVQDTQNLPFYYSKYNPSARSYNFGMGGYGPQNMLAQLETFNFDTIVKEKDGSAYYMYLLNHEARAIGDMTTYVNWGKDLPYYDYEADSLVRKGSFSENRTITSSLYSLLGASNTVKYFNMNFPATIREQDYKLTTDIIINSYKLYKKKFNNENFYVIIYPSGTPSEIIKYLKDKGIKLIDLTTLFDPMEKGYYISEYDRHPTPLAYETIAKAVNEKVLY